MISLIHVLIQFNALFIVVQESILKLRKIARQPKNSVIVVYLKIGYGVLVGVRATCCAFIELSRSFPLFETFIARRNHLEINSGHLCSS